MLFSSGFIKIMSLVSFLALSSCAVTNKTTPILKRTIEESSQLTPDADTQGKKRVVVLPFLDAISPQGREFAKEGEKTLLQKLQKSSQLSVFSTQALEWNLSNLPEDSYQMSAFLESAKKNSLAAIIEGKLLDIKIKKTSDTVGVIRNLSTTFEILLQLRIFHVRKNKDIFNTVKTITLEQKDVRVGERVQSDQFVQQNPQLIKTLVKDAFLEYYPQIISSLQEVTWQGRIAEIQGERLFLNVGKSSGLKIGDLLRVIEESREIYDSESGSVLGRPQGRLKGTLEVISFFGKDGSIAKVHSGQNFQENDSVELYDGVH